MESAHALVIDDNVTNIDVLVMLLAQQGVTTRSVASLPSVRAALEAYSVHISEIERVRREGFQGFLGKPLDARRFPQQLQKILNGIPVWEM
jgi:DNA-binding NtrC family response regulator